MKEEFESFMETQLRALKAQMKIIREHLREYEEKNKNLKRRISNELIDALIKRFETNEKMIQNLNEKLDSVEFRFQNQLSNSIKNLREDLIDTELSKAISKLSEEREIKISSKALDELKKI